MPTSNTRRAGPSPMRGPAAAVRRAVASVSPIVTMWRDGLTIIALESREPNRPPEYLTFEQAQAAQGLAVEEAAVQTVPTVDATTGPMPVLLLGGDTIIGGAQNRIINITILLKAAAKTAIPVSCLEMGRWNDGRRFESSRPVDHTLRSMVAEQVTRGRSFAAGSAHRPAQESSACSRSSRLRSPSFSNNEEGELVRIAVLVIALIAGILSLLQACTVAGLSGLGDDTNLQGGAALRLFVGFFILIGGAFVMGLPTSSQWCSSSSQGSPESS